MMGSKLLKPVRYKNGEYKEFIKKQPCCITGQFDVDPHHTKSVGSGGSDLTLVPLIHRLHQECHNIGQDTFQAKYNIDFKLIRLALLQKWIEENL
jgi:hypothetical protein